MVRNLLIASIFTDNLGFSPVVKNFKNSVRRCFVHNCLKYIEIFNVALSQKIFYERFLGHAVSQRILVFDKEYTHI